MHARLKKDVEELQSPKSGKTNQSRRSKSKDKSQSEKVFSDDHMPSEMINSEPSRADVAAESRRNSLLRFKEQSKLMK